MRSSLKGAFSAVGAVEALLAAGADPDAQTPTGKSVRELAALNHRDKVIEVLNGGMAALSLGH